VGRWGAIPAPQVRVERSEAFPEQRTHFAKKEFLQSNGEWSSDFWAGSLPNAQLLQGRPEARKRVHDYVVAEQGHPAPGKALGRFWWKDWESHLQRKKARSSRNRPPGGVFVDAPGDLPFGSASNFCKPPDFVGRNVMKRFERHNRRSQSHIGARAGAAACGRARIRGLSDKALAWLLPSRPDHRAASGESTIFPPDLDGLYLSFTNYRAQPAECPRLRWMDGESIGTSSILNRSGKFGRHAGDSTLCHLDRHHRGQRLDSGLAFLIDKKFRGHGVWTTIILLPD